MLSISKMALPTYYEKMQEEDYYSRKSLEHGIWTGSGAQDLGLPRNVEPEVLARLMQGYSPEGERALVMNAGSPKRAYG